MFQLVFGVQPVRFDVNRGPARRSLPVLVSGVQDIPPRPSGSRVPGPGDPAARYRVPGPETKSQRLDFGSRVPGPGNPREIFPFGDPLSWTPVLTLETMILFFIKMYVRRLLCKKSHKTGALPMMTSATFVSDLINRTDTLSIIFVTKIFTMYKSSLYEEEKNARKLLQTFLAIIIFNM